MKDNTKASVGIAAAMAAISAAVLTNHHGLLIGIVGGAVLGAIIGLVVAFGMGRRR
jgi:ribose/xylose/arabinose/galactoside ABC-type transport system permease subunit